MCYKRINLLQEPMLDMVTKSKFYVIPDNMHNIFMIKYIRISFGQPREKITALYHHRAPGKDHIRFFTRKEFWQENGELKHNVDAWPGRYVYLSDPVLRAIDADLTNIFIQSASGLSKKFGKCRGRHG